MLLKYSFDQDKAADDIEKAVNRVLLKARTADIYAEGLQKVGCVEMGNLVCREIEAL